MYAITDDGRAILIRALKEAAPAKAEKPAKAPAKKAKPAAKKAAAPKPDGSKVEIVIAMLTGRKAITCKDIAEATGWPSVNIKAICGRKGMKLKKLRPAMSALRLRHNPVNQSKPDSHWVFGGFRPV